MILKIHNAASIFGSMRFTAAKCFPDKVAPERRQKRLFP